MTRTEHFWGNTENSYAITCQSIVQQVSAVIFPREYQGKLESIEVLLILRKTLSESRVIGAVHTRIIDLHQRK